MDTFDEDYLKTLELIDGMSSVSGNSDDLVDLREAILLKLAQLKGTVEIAAIEGANQDMNTATEIEHTEKIEAARQSIELGYRRLRNAQVVANHNRLERWNRQREELLKPASKHEQDESQQESEVSIKSQTSRGIAEFNPAVSKSEDITATLRRVHQMAQGEVLKGELNIDELDSSTKTLRELEDKYSAVDVLLNGSRRLVKVLEEADRGDRRRMQFALGFLAAVMCWIIYRRVLKLPLKILFWNLVNLLRLGKWASKVIPYGKLEASQVSESLVHHASESEVPDLSKIPEIPSLGSIVEPETTQVRHHHQPPRVSIHEPKQEPNGLDEKQQPGEHKIVEEPLEHHYEEFVGTRPDKSENAFEKPVDQNEKPVKHSSNELGLDEEPKTVFDAETFDPELIDLDDLDFEAFLQARLNQDMEESTEEKPELFEEPIYHVQDTEVIKEAEPTPMSETGTIYYAPHDTSIKDEL